MYNAQLMVFRKGKLIKRVKELFMFNLNDNAQAKTRRKRQEKTREGKGDYKHETEKENCPQRFCPKVKNLVRYYKANFPHSARQRMLRESASHSLLFPR